MSETPASTELTPDASLASTSPAPPVALASPTPAPAPSDPEEIRRGIERTRAEMDATFDALSERLSPRHLLDDVIDLWQGRDDSGRGARRTLRDTGVRLGESIRDHPVPAALIGAGIAWLMLEEKRSESEIRTVSDAGRRLSPTQCAETESDLERMSFPGEEGEDFVAEPRNKSVVSAPGIREELSELSTRVRSRGEAAGSRAGSTSRQLAGTLERWLDEAPLAAGIAALAAGLAVGLVLPGTRREDELMGKASDSVKQSIRP